VQSVKICQGTASCSTQAACRSDSGVSSGALRWVHGKGTVFPDSATSATLLSVWSTKSPTPGTAISRRDSAGIVRVVFIPKRVGKPRPRDLGGGNSHAFLAAFSDLSSARKGLSSQIPNLANGTAMYRHPTVPGFPPEGTSR
jgi:hypothetical protein